MWVGEANNQLDISYLGLPVRHVRTNQVKGTLHSRTNLILNKLTFHLPSKMPAYAQASSLSTVTLMKIIKTYLSFVEYFSLQVNDTQRCCSFLPRHPQR